MWERWNMTSVEHKKEIKNPSNVPCSLNMFRYSAEKLSGYFPALKFITWFNCKTLLFTTEHVNSYYRVNTLISQAYVEFFAAQHFIYPWVRLFVVRLRLFCVHLVWRWTQDRLCLKTNYLRNASWKTHCRRHFVKTNNARCSRLYTRRTTRGIAGRTTITSITCGNASSFW